MTDLRVWHEVVKEFRHQMVLSPQLPSEVISQLDTACMLMSRAMEAVIKRADAEKGRGM